jgi:hypothetical protein
MMKCFQFCFNFALRFNLRRYTMDWISHATGDSTPATPAQDDMAASAVHAEIMVGFRF